jgi:hypothetical protein
LIYKDPSGHCSEDDDACWEVYNQVTGEDGLGYEPEGLKKWGTRQLQKLLNWIKVGVVFEKGGQWEIGHDNWPTQSLNWNAAEIGNVMAALNRIVNVVGYGSTLAALGLNGQDKLHLFRLENAPDDKAGTMNGWFNTRYIYFGRFDPNRPEWMIESTIHEFGHYIDLHLGGDDFWSNKSSTWSISTGWPQGATGKVVSKYAQTDATEDFAETFVWYIETANGGKYSGEDIGDPSDGRVAALTVALSNYYTCLPPTCYR